MPDPNAPDSFAPGRAVEVAPGIRRIVAPNPGRMTGPGTNSWLVGTRTVLVVDPGPAIPAHVAALVAAIGGARVAGVLVTHTHRDHSDGRLPPGALRRRGAGEQRRQRAGGHVAGEGDRPADRGAHRRQRRALQRAAPAEGDRIAALGVVAIEFLDRTLGLAETK
jgi:glyoxylase-like metal-dependent hydrolase (beta-lactamase superfamily II)